MIRPILPLILLTILTAFRAVGQFTVITNSGSLTITGYSGTNQSLVIPSTLDGLPVTAIGDEAFLQNSLLTSVALSDGVMTVGHAAFEGCANLVSVNLPASVSNIGAGAFATCSRLASLDVDSANNSYSSLGGVLFDKARTKLVQYPNGVGGNYAVPPTVTEIASAAFVNCLNLIGVIIPSSVAQIDDQAFENCSALADVSLTNGLVTIGFQAFAATGVTNVTLPGSATSVGGQAFQNCNALLAVAVPDSVTNIGQRAFAGCSSLMAINVDSFNPNYSSAGGVLFDQGQATLLQYPGGLPGICVIPAGVTRIEDFAFAWCSQLSGVSIPYGVTAIGDNAFYSCVGLTSVTIPTSVVAIADEPAYGNTFYGCTNLNNVVFQGDAPTNGQAAFTGDRLAAVYYPPNASGWSGSFGGVTAQASSIAVETGSAQVTLAPAKAIPAGAKWRIDGGEWQDGGATVAGLSVGNHGLSFSVVKGWAGPAKQTIAIANNATNFLSGEYSSAGFLRVAIAPAAAVRAGARWAVDGGQAQTSGATVSNLAVGSHTVQFSGVGGWATPATLTVVVRAKQRAASRATYGFLGHGVYQGLFYADTGVTPDAAGIIRSFTVTSQGSYSGRLVQAGRTYPLTGSFDATGNASNYVARPGSPAGPLSVALTLNWNAVPPVVAGAVATDSSAAAIHLDQAAAHPYSAEYTMLTVPTETPPGSGYLLISDHRGNITISGVLADGTPFSQNTPVAADGTVPLYAGLYRGAGLLLGWLNLSPDNSTTNAVSWIAPASSSSRYEEGFTNELSVIASPWIDPPVDTAAIDLPAGTLTLSGGMLNNTIVYNVALSDHNTLQTLPGGVTNFLSGSVNPRTGRLTITFGNGNGKATTVGQGAILQSSSSGGGFFLTKTNAGAVSLSP